VVGICLGHELIAHAFNFPLTHFEVQHVGMTQVEVVGAHDMFVCKKIFPVYENHQYGVTEVNHKLEILAKTDHAIAVLKHCTRPIYGLQFHPEHHTDKQFSDEVYLKLFKELIQK
jgi:GMP synthase (glutamine-hydrolysing)